MGSEKHLSLAGIMGFPVTPFDHNENVNEKAFEANVQFLLAGGLDSVFVCAGSGEFQSLDIKEYEQLVTIGVAVSAGKVPVFAGAGGNLKEAVERVQLAEKIGADGLLLLPPYLIIPEQEGLYNYYRTIAVSTALPVIIYQRDNAVFTLKTLERLANLPNVIGFKDGLGNFELNIEFVQSLGNKLQWMNGMPLAELTMPAYHALGFHSYSSAISNYIPQVSRKFHESLIGGNQELLQMIYREVILPIHRIRQQRKGYAVSLIKAGMDIVGLPVGLQVRSPLVEVEREHYVQLESIIKKSVDLIAAANNL
ncbi:5-dehydro-4-deoxyglucarate dehydratase [Paenibacillus chondroitinus]|uniref:Probable 5-dehydro-4-deoxyglucarate dehydratase n=1 Tax=Paenibacillus chondroitinus TaxID=59842 RepID=A0ABU6D8D4_9BACL|nr:MULTISPECIES: 5-dehydro-4-deoxyglucarate dehydratase [Paenibacillus]MCY9659800.1 5-dehydro-4-deoxyglucarate dehydratase [Paenibacillus anseongense]MEB4794021.1 5-dehydro-4-deoxyglucarate dehydratase [Paenibacillus chondroitinus]